MNVLVDNSLLIDFENDYKLIHKLFLHSNGNLLQINLQKKLYKLYIYNLLCNKIMICNSIYDDYIINNIISYNFTTLNIPLIKNNNYNLPNILLIGVSIQKCKTHLYKSLDILNSTIKHRLKNYTNYSKNIHHKSKLIYSSTNHYIYGLDNIQNTYINYYNQFYQIIIDYLSTIFENNNNGLYILYINNNIIRLITSHLSLPYRQIDLKQSLINYLFGDN